MSVCAPSLQKLLTNQIQRQIHEKDRANDQDIMCLSWLKYSKYDGWYLTLVYLVTLDILVKLFSYPFFPEYVYWRQKNIQQAVFVASFFLIYLCLKFASFLSCISMQDLDLFKVKLWLKVVFKGNFSCLRSAMTWKYFTAHFSASLQYRKLLAWLFIKPCARRDEAMEV